MSSVLMLQRTRHASFKPQWLYGFKVLKRQLELLINKVPCLLSPQSLLSNNRMLQVVLCLDSGINQEKKSKSCFCEEVSLCVPNVYVVVSSLLTCHHSVFSSWCLSPSQFTASLSSLPFACSTLSFNSNQNEGLHVFYTPVCESCKIPLYQNDKKKITQQTFAVRCYFM